MRVQIVSQRWVFYDRVGQLAAFIIMTARGKWTEHLLHFISELRAKDSSSNRVYNFAHSLLSYLAKYYFKARWRRICLQLFVCLDMGVSVSHVCRDLNELKNLLSHFPLGPYLGFLQQAQWSWCQLMSYFVSQMTFGLPITFQSISKDWFDRLFLF